MQAVRTLACIGPGGKSGDCAQKSGAAYSENNAIANPLRLNLLGLNILSLNTDFHLVDGVIEISAGIPGRGLRLNTALTVGSARQDRVLARVWTFPNETPQSPRIFCLLAAQARRLPGGA